MIEIHDSGLDLCDADLTKEPVGICHGAPCSKVATQVLRVQGNQAQLFLKAGHREGMVEDSKLVMHLRQGDSPISTPTTAELPTP